MRSSSSIDGRQRVAAGDRDDEAEVGPDEAVLGRGGGADGPAGLARLLLAGVEALLGLAALLDDLGELALLLGGEERHHADLVEVLTD